MMLFCLRDSTRSWESCITHTVLALARPAENIAISEEVLRPLSDRTIWAHPHRTGSPDQEGSLASCNHSTLSQAGQSGTSDFVNARPYAWSALSLAVQVLYLLWRVFWACQHFPLLQAPSVTSILM